MTQTLELVVLIAIPFIGSILGSCFVLGVKQSATERLAKLLLGFAAGVMVAASIWSLLVPSLELAATSTNVSASTTWVPAMVGLWIGVLFLLALDHIIPHLHVTPGEPDQDEGPKTHLSKTAKLVLAIGLHNIPEGMALGVVLAGWMAGEEYLTFAAALSLAVGIAVQNAPEGAIVSFPLLNEGASKARACGLGIASSAVEPLACIATLFASSLVLPALPYLLGFAAGAMLYVVVEELIPEMAQGPHSNAGTLFFMVGFTLMTVLDTALG
jgi:ZIP family zinc transporter